MEYFVLIDSEFKSLIRNCLERIVKYYLPLYINYNYINILFGISTRIVCSLIAIFLYKLIENNNSFNTIINIVSYIGVIVFIAIIIYNNKVLFYNNHHINK
tara:strand:+ start:56 stop:358 length:303 start_codon:yes stop_codon:yes gene_type:complete